MAAVRAEPTSASHAILLYGSPWSTRKTESPLTPSSAAGDLVFGECAFASATCSICSRLGFPPSRCSRNFLTLKRTTLLLVFGSQAVGSTTPFSPLETLARRATGPIACALAQRYLWSGRCCRTRCWSTRRNRPRHLFRGPCCLGCGFDQGCGFRQATRNPRSTATGSMAYVRQHVERAPTGLIRKDMAQGGRAAATWRTFGTNQRLKLMPVS